MRSKSSELGGDVDVTEYRGPESYEQQSADGRGGQSGIFDQHDYPPRDSVPGEPPREDDGHLAPVEDLEGLPNQTDHSAERSS